MDNPRVEMGRRLREILEGLILKILRKRLLIRARLIQTVMKKSRKKRIQ